MGKGKISRYTADRSKKQLTGAPAQHIRVSKPSRAREQKSAAWDKKRKEEQTIDRDRAELVVLSLG